MSSGLIKQIEFYYGHFGGDYPLTQKEFSEIRKLLGAPNEASVSRDHTNEQASQPTAWRNLTGVGQIKKGDCLRIWLGDKTLTVKAQAILNPGQTSEEVVYNRKRNYYFIVSMVLDGSSLVKAVEFMTPEAGRHTGDHLCEQKTESIMERGYAHTGYVLMSPVGEYCVINGSAVRWMDKDQMWTLMHPDQSVSAGAN